jgi:hypothetical protein
MVGTIRGLVATNLVASWVACISSGLHLKRRTGEWPFIGRITNIFGKFQPKKDRKWPPFPNKRFGRLKNRGENKIVRTKVTLGPDSESQPPKGYSLVLSHGYRVFADNLQLRSLAWMTTSKGGWHLGIWVTSVTRSQPVNIVHYILVFGSDVSSVRLSANPGRTNVHSNPGPTTMKYLRWSIWNLDWRHPLSKLHSITLLFRTMNTHLLSSSLLRYYFVVQESVIGFRYRAHMFSRWISIFSSMVWWVSLLELSRTNYFLFLDFGCIGTSMFLINSIRSSPVYFGEVLQR